MYCPPVTPTVPQHCPGPLFQYIPPMPPRGRWVWVPDFDLPPGPPYFDHTYRPEYAPTCFASN